jgi:nucleoside-triphosphatase
MTETAPVFIITGEHGQCKTTFLYQMLGLITGLNVRLQGVIAPGHVRDGRRSGFTLVDLATGRHELLCSIDPSPECEAHGRFYFRPEGLALGRRALSLPDTGETDLLVIDEVGRFELQGAVWAAELDRLCALPHPPMVWTVRRRLLDTVIERWSLGNPVVVDVGAAGVLSTASNVMDAVWEWRETHPVSPPFPTPFINHHPAGDLSPVAKAATGVSAGVPSIFRKRYDSVD